MGTDGVFMVLRYSPAWRRPGGAANGRTVGFAMARPRSKRLPTGLAMDLMAG